MLQTKDCVTIKDLKEPVNYDRVYFEYANVDRTADLTKTSGGSDLKDGAGNVWKGTKPAEAVSVKSHADLVSEAVNFLTNSLKLVQGEKESDEEFIARKSSTAWRNLLSYASRGYDAATRNDIQANNRPVEKLDHEAFVAKTMKAFMQTGFFTTEAAKAQAETVWTSTQVAA